jgi:hypothetical protein
VVIRRSVLMREEVSATESSWTGLGLGDLSIPVERVGMVSWTLVYHIASGVSLRNEWLMAFNA